MFHAAAQERGLPCVIDSAGTAAYHVGGRPDPRAISIASSHGINISGQSARQVERNDFYRFDHIIAMDRANLEGLRAKAPRDATAKLSMLLDLVHGREGQGVADPYYGETADFEAALFTISLGVDAWIDRLQREASVFRA